ncbi:hypothetical protein LTR85_001852 [Meristemomyces frigidus]|nr:hypothetical protein LTR85_001852 [Meristemomyces frigidus]
MPLPKCLADYSDQRGDDPCRLLQLPGEIRNQIFEDAVRQSDGIVIHIGIDSTSTNNQHVLALEMTCKQIKREVGNLVLELNTLELRAPIFEVEPDSGDMSVKESIFPEAQDIADPLSRALRNVRHGRELREIRIWLGRGLSLTPCVTIGCSSILEAVSLSLRRLHEDGVKVVVTFDSVAWDGVTAALEFDLNLNAAAVAAMVQESRSVSTMVLKQYVMDPFFP